jgi:DNA-binding Lrp family transcriptional regulator
MSAVKEPERLLHQIRARLPAGRGLLPADPALLGPLLGLVDSEEEIQKQLEQLIEEGVVRRVLVGTEPHLALGRTRRLTHLIAVSANATVSQPVKKVKRRDRELQKLISQDQEAERIILLRVGVVIFALIALLLIRALALE